MTGTMKADPVRTIRWHGLLRLLLIVLIAALTLGALFAVGVLLFGRFGDLEQKIMISTFTLAWFSLLGMAAALRIERRRAVWLGWAGVAFSAAAYGMAVAGVWLEPESRVFERLLISLITTTGVCALASLLLLVRPSTPLVRGVMAATLVGLGLLWVGGEVLILWTPEEPSELFLRGLGAVGVLTGLGALLAPILERLAGGKRRPVGPPATRDEARAARRAA